jgi:hypothetical protein
VQAAALVDGWLAAGGDPAHSPFEPTTDMGWFYRELKQDLPTIDAVSDAVPRQTKVPIWMSGTDEAPARVVAIRLSRPPLGEEFDEVFSLATKYDLVVFNPHRPSVHLPLEQMSALASATFWPNGAIRGAVAGVIGAAIAAGAWVIGIPILSGIAIIVGLFLVVLTLWTFVHELRKRLGGPHD